MLKLDPLSHNFQDPRMSLYPLPNSQEPSHTCSADRVLLETYLHSTVMSIIRKADKPPPPPITDILTAEL